MGVCFLVAKCGKDGLHDSVSVPKDVVVPEPNDSIALVLEPSGAPCVACDLSCVLSAINFDDEPAFETYEIDDEPSNGCLAAKETPIELAVAQP